MNPLIDQKNARLIIVSNRLPIVIESKDKKLHIVPGSGGLVTALAPVLRHRGGLWIGWTGTFDANEQEIKQLFEESKQKAGYDFIPVFLTKEEVEAYYQGFANEILWPLFHDMQTKCHFVPSYWLAYQHVNAKFANATLQVVQPNDFIWIQDYHLITLGQDLRKLGCQAKLGYFLHIPFPPLDIFIKLPWRFQIIRALLEYDLIGFQTMRDTRNFIQCIRFLLKDVQIKNGRSIHVCKIGEREVRVGAFPISIDYNEFMKRSQGADVEQKTKHLNEIFSNKKLIFSLDRLDYTKGIPYRLEAIRTFLKKYPEFHKNVVFIQVVIPSRTDIPKYHELKEEIDRMVGEINSEFSKDEWIPINYVFHTLNRDELGSYYRKSDIALVTPLKDGMNLVAKEYVASHIQDDGVLILSEFAGVAAQFHKEAILINPYDIEGVAEAIHTALTLPENQKRKRMRKMQRDVKSHDVFWWVASFLNAAIAKELVDFPLVQEYIPKDTGEKDFF